MKPALLYLVHRIPYPPNKGDKIRSYNFLRFLAEHYRVFLGAFVDDPSDADHQQALSAWCAETRLIRLSPALARLRGLKALLDGTALSIPFYWDAAMAHWVAQVVEREDPKRVLVFSSPMAQYVMGGRFDDIRRVVDFVDVDSDKWRQYAETRA